MNRVIYKGDCSCGSPYIGETKRKAEVDWLNIMIQLKVQNLRNNINLCFTRTIISNTPKTAKTNKILGASYIAL